MSRNVTRWFAVVALSGGAARADTAPVKPIVLATGQPACGNLMRKSGPDPICRVIEINRELEDKGRQFQRKLRESWTAEANPPEPRRGR